MSRLWGWGILGLLVAAAGCVPSGQYLDMKQKYDDSQLLNRKLENDNSRLQDQNRLLAARGAGSGRQLTKEEIDKIMSEYGKGGDGIIIKPGPGLDPLPDGGAELKADLAFRSGSAELSDKGKIALDNLAEQFKAQPPVRLMVKGHTDNDPISKSHNASNWELSGKRAAAVVDYLVKKGAVDGLNAELRGFGEFHPLSTEKAKNRRVEIYAFPIVEGGSVKAPAAVREEGPRAEPATPKASPKASPKDPTLK